jgi:hypothetical protein
MIVFYLVLNNDVIRFKREEEVRKDQEKKPDLLSRVEADLCEKLELEMEMELRMVRKFYRSKNR